MSSIFKRGNNKTEKKDKSKKKKPDEDAAQSADYGGDNGPSYQPPPPQSQEHKPTHRQQLQVRTKFPPAPSEGSAAPRTDDISPIRNGMLEGTTPVAEPMVYSSGRSDPQLFVPEERQTLSSLRTHLKLTGETFASPSDSPSSAGGHAATDQAPAQQGKKKERHNRGMDVRVNTQFILPDIPKASPLDLGSALKASGSGVSIPQSAGGRSNRSKRSPTGSAGSNNSSNGSIQSRKSTTDSMEQSHATIKPASVVAASPRSAVSRRSTRSARSSKPAVNTVSPTAAPLAGAGGAGSSKRVSDISQLSREVPYTMQQYPGNVSPLSSDEDTKQQNLLGTPARRTSGRGGKPSHG